ncbi:MAG: DUF5694 domain-containing protein [Bacteroidales bacterium]|nr:DUF5694 domain-containing protein [Bacteroidales bacterium]
MRKTILFLIVLCHTLISTAQQQKQQAIEVLTLGVFHFNFPNLDVQQISKSQQINVLDKKYQKEIKLIVDKLSDFEPSIIVIEVDPKKQSQIDSLYKLYLQNKYKLKRDEEEQIGFRLAKKQNLKKLYCVNDWGDLDHKIKNVLLSNDTSELKKFERYIANNPDKDKVSRPRHIFKTQGILKELIQLNNPENIKNSLGAYLTGPFKYEINEGDFFGTKFETGRWFSRNLKIFRNIQRINTKPSDRILVIFGAGHLNLLNVFFESSPEYKLVKTNDYLK